MLSRWGCICDRARQLCCSTIRVRKPRVHEEEGILSRYTSIGRVLGESLVIVVSVLVAFSADAWWQARQDDSRRDDHLASLALDFDLMSQRADSSLAVAVRAWVAGERLLEGLAAGGSIPPDSASLWLTTLIHYEVFSPSTGSYESLVASGDLGLLRDIELSRELAAFFGSFEDVRVSEDGLVSAIRDINASEEFARLAGYHRRMRMHRANLPTFGEVSAQSWAQSDFLLHGFSRLTLLQGALIEDYRFLRDRLDEIGMRLTATQRSAS